MIPSTMMFYPESLAFYAAAVPAVLLVGLSKGGFQGLSVLSLPLLSLATQPFARGRHHAADPDRAGCGQRLVVPQKF